MILQNLLLFVFAIAGVLVHTHCERTLDEDMAKTRRVMDFDDSFDPVLERHLAVGRGLRRVNTIAKWAFGFTAAGALLLIILVGV
jgi:hypothetical protein